MFSDSVVWERASPGGLTGGPVCFRCEVEAEYFSAAGPSYETDVPRFAAVVVFFPARAVLDAPGDEASATPARGNFRFLIADACCRADRYFSDQYCVDHCAVSGVAALLILVASAAEYHVLADVDSSEAFAGPNLHSAHLAPADVGLPCCPSPSVVAGWWVVPGGHCLPAAAVQTVPWEELDFWSPPLCGS